MSEIREEFNENLLDHNKVPIPSPQPGDMVFAYFTGVTGVVIEKIEENKSRVLWNGRSRFIVGPGYFVMPGELKFKLKFVSVNLCVEGKP